MPSHPLCYFILVVTQGGGYSSCFIGVEANNKRDHKATPCLMRTFQKDYPESLEKLGLQVWLVGTSFTCLTSDS